MEVPIQTMLKIGKATVGVIGLDVALNRVLSPRDLSTDACVQRVFAEIKDNNYIPESANGIYKEAIAREISRLRGEGEGQEGFLIIRILGPGCVSCNNLQKLVIEIMSDMGIAADVFQVHDLDEIGRFGVMQTPALVVNGRLKCSGRLPGRAQVEAWLRDELP